jgi:hypothetical protein
MKVLMGSTLLAIAFGLRLNGSAVAQQLQSACDANDDGFGSSQEAQLCTDREFDEIARGEQVLTEELLKAKAENSKGTPAFDDADQNGDGQISRQEWARFSGGAVRPGDRGERRPHERRRVQRVARSGHAGPAAALKATLGLDTARGVAPRALTSLYKSRRPYGRSRADASKLSSWPIEGPGTSRSGYKQVRLQAGQATSDAASEPRPYPAVVGPSDPASDAGSGGGWI